MIRFAQGILLDSFQELYWTHNVDAPDGLTSNCWTLLAAAHTVASSSASGGRQKGICVLGR